MSEQVRHDYTPSSDLDGSPCAICGDRPGDDHYEFAAQPAPGRWHWYTSNHSVCNCTDGNHRPTHIIEALNALEAERGRYEGLFLSSQQSLTLVEQELRTLEAERAALREGLDEFVGWAAMCDTLFSAGRDADHLLNTDEGWRSLVAMAEKALDAAQKARHE